MSTDFKFTSGDQATPENVAQVPLLLGTSSLGVIGDGYTFNPGDDVEGSIGSGPCVGLALAMGQVGPCVVGPVAPTYTALPSVTHLDASGGQSPTGPAITLTLAEAGVGPLDWSNLLLSVTADGMHVAIAYDGTTAAETMPIPPPTPAVLVGTAPITPTVLGSANGQTLVFSAPASQTLTLAAGSLAAAPAGIQAAVATITGGHTYTSSSWLAAGVAALAANPRKLTWTTAGMTPADVPTSITVTGTDYTTAVQTETITPDTSAGSVTTTKVYASLTSWSYTSAGGTAATLAVGYADAYATPQELANAVTTLATAAPLAVAGTVAQNSTEQLLQLASTAIGPGVTMTLSAQTLFGFASTPAPGNLTATGANGLRPFDWLGVVASFPAGPYTPLESYKAALVGPRGAVSDYVNALQNAINNFTQYPFGYVVVTESMSSNANARALYDALRVLATTYQQSPDNPVLFYVVTPTALHAASPVAATNATGITAFETDLLTQFSGAATSLNSVSVDDCYIAGPPRKPGTFRVPSTWAAALKVSSLTRLAGNPCDGAAVGVSLLGADGTRARDDAKSTTKLAGLGGAGFWALKSMANGQCKFGPAATRAGSLDRYRSPGAVAFALAASFAIVPTLQSWEGTWETDPANPTNALPDLLTHRAGILETLIDPIAYPENAPENVANFIVTITGVNILNTGQAAVSLQFNPLAVAEMITATITATGVALSTSTTG